MGGGGLPLNLEDVVVGGREGEVRVEVAAHHGDEADLAVNIELLPGTGVQSVQE